ncbi:hypothetical protein JQ621_26300 [Bradyrhizobium manausense]|uniref:hypothetical protein n=1 Tax=Bradyrhizobium manausense TaxID=989370 RepID=UPI001BA6E1B2|nr:hypothetical protein [Bradyrhizobium manausense]MBR1090988.1 hypothetical protein [Bradyrhizobium manausense]
MTTEKQAEANRRNAQKSTGPRTAAGRLKSSRNAVRHGLSIPVAANALEEMQQHRFVELLIPEGASQPKKLAALELARAQTQLERVAAVRKGLMAELDLQSPSLEQVRRLAALERYEGRAQRQRRRAREQLLATESVEEGVE